MRKSLLLASVFALAPSLAFSADVVIENAWTRASLSAAVKNAAGYMTIRNTTDKADALIAIKGNVADVTEVHEMTFVDGVMRMNAIESLEIPANGEANLEPGGYHVMFLGLKEPFKEGESFNLTLIFENAGEVEVPVTIREPYQKQSHQH